MNYTSPLFQAALDKADFTPEQKEQIISQVIEAGTCQQITILPEAMRNVYVVSADISAHEHIRMQAALQRLWITALARPSTSRLAPPLRKSLTHLWKPGN